MIFQAGIHPSEPDIRVGALARDCTARTLALMYARSTKHDGEEVLDHVLAKLLVSKDDMDSIWEGVQS